MLLVHSDNEAGSLHIIKVFMTPHITQDVIEHIAPREVIMQAWNAVVAGLQYCTQDTARARWARQSWFGKHMESSPELLARLTLLQNFVNSTKPLTIAFDPLANIPTAIAYTYSRRLDDPLRVPAIYLTRKFCTAQTNDRVKYLMKNRNNNGVQIIALAHELSHLVIGTNRKTGNYSAEKYAHEAKNLRDRDPQYALHNADNYGFCIEMCS
ncbi:hypothetical protein [Rahnella rivi]|uniref:hypothetical protein n=2 Tax=Rahnella rivi TaxID=2816249 RepID=UPI0039BEA3F4